MQNRNVICPVVHYSMSPWIISAASSLVHSFTTLINSDDETVNQLKSSRALVWHTNNEWR